MRNIFDADETYAVLLVDAPNAFNALNRAAALHNVRISCPTIATCAINNYRLPARLFILGGKELTSAEGTTQGEPLAMSLYVSVYNRSSLFYRSLFYRTRVRLGNAGLLMMPQGVAHWRISRIGGMHY